MATIRAKTAPAVSTSNSNPVRKNVLKKSAVRSAKPITKKIGAVEPASPKRAVTAPTSKQTTVLTLLRNSAGVSLATLMKTTGWQQHSVRGFLAGVVKKQLKLELASNKVGDERIYRIIKTGGRR